ncbi:MAG TPA: glycosyltransferase family 39 protein [Streptosporangiaceae bacterium]|jgi:4-amino-4-deoxy-L-arabinose transferase-like glycosyltransferase
MTSPAAFIRRHPLVIPLAVCAALNAAVLLAVAARHPEYLRDYRTNPNPDAPHYVLLGRNVFLHGAYSRSAEPPFVTDIFRTPGYPVFAGGLDLLGGAGLIYAVQALLHLGLCALTYALARRAFGPRAGFVSALLVAVHPTLLALNVQAMSETAFLFLLAAGVLALMAGLPPAAAPRRLDLAAGVLLGLATLVRPAGLYLPLMLAAVLAVAVARADGFRRAARRSLTFVAGVAVCLAPWVARNYAVFGTATLTTNDTVVLVYFTGAGAYQLHHGVDRETASAMIAREFGLHPPEDMWNYHATGDSPVAMDRQARRAVVPVLTRYPLDLCRSCALGLVKSFFSHDAGTWARILDLPGWVAPGTGGLLTLRPDAWGRLLGNHPFLIAVFVAQLLLSAALVLLAAAGAVRAVRRGGAPAYLVLCLLGFFALVCAASGVDAYTRFSAPILPFACVLAGSAWAARRGAPAPRNAPAREFVAC